jgi:NTP pyrophosphatase (non-canonical NTP hydrolase)
MELDEIVLKIREKYFERDRGSGSLFLLAVLFEEVGELAEAVRKNQKEQIGEELCDVLFMVLSIANLYGVDVVKRLIEKYIEDDPSHRWDLPS